MRLNEGPTKSVARTVGHTRYPADDAFCEVELYAYLGVTLDRFLTFQPLLQSLLNKGRDAFSSFWGKAESLVLPIPLVASLIPNRVVTKTLYGVEFLIGIADAEGLLNRMQVTWARHVLGISGTRAGSTSLLLAACGWEQRLGTAVTLAQLLRLVPHLRALFGVT